MSANGHSVSNGGQRLEPHVTEQKEVVMKYETETLGLGLAYFTTDRPRGVVDDSDSNNQIFKESGEDHRQGV